ncbi:MAG: GldG family protein [Chitinispirillaceae bacterium]
METKKIKTRTELAVIIAAVLAVVALVNYGASSLFRRIDLTENKQYTVSKASKKLLRGMDDIVNIKVFFSNDLPPETYNTVTTVKDLLSEFQNLAGNKLRITYENPSEDKDAADAARSFNVPEVTLQTVKKDKAQAMKGYMGIGIGYGNKKESIPIIQNLNNLEYDLAQGIMKVMRDSEPKVGILKTQSGDFIPNQVSPQMNAQQETTEKKYAPLFDELRRDYTVNTVDISKGEPIDEDIKTLIIPGGTNFTDRQLFEIDQFFMNGGNLIAMTDPVSISFQQGARGIVQETKILDLLEHYGVKVERNLVQDASCSHVAIPKNVGPFTFNERVPYPYFVRIGSKGFNKDNPAVSSHSELVLAWASGLTFKADTANTEQQKVKATPLVSSSDQSWITAGSFDLQPKAEYDVPEEDKLEPQVLAAHLSGDFSSYFKGKSVPPVKDASSDTAQPISLSPEDASRSVNPSNSKGNLVVIGDADFVSDQNTTKSNLLFMHNLVDWLSLDDNLIQIRSRVLKDKTIDANVLEEGSKTPNMIRLANILTMPLLVIIVGIFISLRRREKISPAPVSVTTREDNNNGKK